MVADFPQSKQEKASTQDKSHSLFFFFNMHNSLGFLLLSFAYVIGGDITYSTELCMRNKQGNLSEELSIS